MVCLVICFLPAFISIEKEERKVAFHTVGVSASFIVAFAVCIPMIFDLVLDVIEDNLISKQQSQSVYRFYLARILIILGLIFPPVMFAHSTEGFSAFNSNRGVSSCIAAMVDDEYIVALFGVGEFNQSPHPKKDHNIIFFLRKIKMCSPQ